MPQEQHKALLRSHDASHAGAAHVDDWHHHEQVEGEPQEEHTSTINTLTVFKWFIGIVIFFALSVLLLIRYFNAVKLDMVRSTVEVPLSKDYLVKRDAIDESLGLRDPNLAWQGLADGKSVRIPIDLAMDKVLKQYETGSKSLAMPPQMLGTLHTPVPTPDPKEAPAP